MKIHIDKILISLSRKKKGKKYKLQAKLVIDNQFYNSITGNKMAVELKPKQTVQIAVGVVDRKGNPAAVESIVFTSDNEEVATVVQDTDNSMSAVITSVGLGVAKISYSVDDMDRDQDVDLEGFLAVEVTPEEAVGFGEVTVGTVTDVE